MSDGGIMAALTSSHCRRAPTGPRTHSAAQEAYDAPMATTPRMKITYATLSADNEELQSAFDAALERARAELGRTYPMIIGGEERLGDETFEDRSPIDRDLVVARFPTGTRQDVRDAIAAARAAFPAWRDTPWRERLAILRRAAELISERQFDYAALMALEVGKNRPRGARRRRGDRGPAALLQRRVREGRWLRQADGLAVGGREDAIGPAPVRRLRRHQPVQLPDGPRRRPGGGAMIAGNTVVLKPSSDAPLGVEVRRGAPRRRPPGRGLQPRHRPGRDGRRRAGGEPRHRRPGVHRQLRGRDAGCIGPSRRTTRGRSSPRWAARTRRSSPATPTSTRPPRASCARPSASTARNAAPTRGSTSSARSPASSSTSSSRRRASIRSATPPSARTGWARSSTSGRSTSSPRPSTRRRATAARSRSAATRDDARGCFPTPTVVTGLPLDHRLFRDELFVPFLVVGEVDSLDEALREANDTAYG